MNASWLPVVNILAPALILAMAAWLRKPSRERGALIAGTVGICVLAIVRLSISSVPTAWLAADSIGKLLGNIAAGITGQPLWVGATFAGLDFIVLMSVFCGVWIFMLPKPRWRTALYAAGAVLFAHLIYLVVLAFVPRILPMLPAPVTAPADSPFQVDTRTWADLARDMMPWDLPILAGFLHLLVAGCLLRWSSSCSRESSDVVIEPVATHRALKLGATIVVAILLSVVVTLGWVGPDLQGKNIVLYEKGLNNWMRPEYGQYGRLSMGMYGLLPTYLQSLGARVVLSPDLVADDLKDAQVLVLVYPNQPWDDGQVSNGQIQRINEFVQRGGSLLLFSDHTTRDADHRNRANDVLAPNEFARVRRADLDEFAAVCARHRREIDAGQPVSGEAPPPVDFAADKFRSIIDTTAKRFAFDAASERRAIDERSRLDALEKLPNTHLRIRFDAAEFTVGGWLQSYEALAHPSTTGMHDDRNQFGVVIGASVDCRWPARPLLVGRWGWIDEGDEGSAQAMLGNHKYDPGEKLGDMVLAAEERVGQGRIIAFGDTSTFNNGINIGAHLFTCRLFSYLANGGGNPQAPARQLIGVLLAIILIALLAHRPDARIACVAALVLAVSLVCCTNWTWAHTEVPPDGSRITRQTLEVQTDPVTMRQVSPRQQWTPSGNAGGERLLAYIDQSHLPASSEESWRPDGCMGVAMSLMRDGYLTLMLHELTEERLKKAAILVSVAPSRAYTVEERAIIKRFVAGGGAFVCTVGWDRHSASRDILDDFGLYVGVAPPEAGRETPAPEPLGFFKSPYYPGDTFQAYVRFFASWPIGFKASDDPQIREVHPIANGILHGKDVPVILSRSYGSGHVILVGDTSFAMNKNLETEEGDAFDGAHENSDFWRWLIPQVTGRTPWFPPKPQPATAPTTAPAEIQGPPLPTTLPTTAPTTAPVTILELGARASSPALAAVKRARTPAPPTLNNLAQLDHRGASSGAGRFVRSALADAFFGYAARLPLQRGYRVNRGDLRRRDTERRRSREIRPDFADSVIAACELDSGRFSLYLCLSASLRDPDRKIDWPRKCAGTPRKIHVGWAYSPTVREPCEQRRWASTPTLQEACRVTLARPLSCGAERTQPTAMVAPFIDGGTNL